MISLFFFFYDAVNLFPRTKQYKRIAFFPSSTFLSSFLSLSLSNTRLYKSTQRAQVFHCKSPYPKKINNQIQISLLFFSLQIYSHVSGTPHQIPLLFLLFQIWLLFHVFIFLGFFGFFFMFDITCVMGLCALTCSVSLWVSYSFRDLVLMLSLGWCSLCLNNIMVLWIVFFDGLTLF